MSFSLLLDEDASPRFDRGINLSWLVFFSLSVHLLFSLLFFFFFPASFHSPLPIIEDYQVSLVSPKQFLPKRRSPPMVKEPLPAPPEPVVQKNAEVRIDLGKPIVPQKSALPAVSTHPVMEDTPKVETAPEPAPSPPSQNEVATEEVSAESRMSATVSLEGPAGEKGTHSGPSFNHPYYLRSIENKIGSKWAPPPAATVSSRRDNRATIIGFLIHRNGQIDARSVLVEKSSGNAFFDIAALRAIHNANPLPPLPKGILDDLRVHFSFTGLDS
jgi:TonB family protein